MKYLLDIDDRTEISIISQFIAILKGMPFVKSTEQITNGKAKLIKEIKESFEEIKEMQAGKKPLKSVKDFLNEL